MADRFGSNIDDDDLIVDLDDAPEELGGNPDEEIADFDPQGLEAPTLPDDMEESTAPAARNAPSARQQQAVEEDLDTGNYELNERVAVAERAVRESQAQNIMVQANANAQLAEKDRAATKVALDSLSLRMTDARQRLKFARDQGDDVAEGQLEEAIEEMKALKTQIEAAQANIPSAQAIIEDGRRRAQGIMAAETASTGKKVGDGIQAKHPLAERWATSNSWIRTNKGANRFVISQSENMVKNGEWDPNTPGFYAELGRRVQNAFPNLKVNPIQSSKPSVRAAAGGRPPVASARSSGGGMGGQRNSANGKQHYRLTAQDQAAMRRANLDPTNKQHARAFAEARMESNARLGQR